jgi:hypothetical protein
MADQNPMQMQSLLPQQPRSGLEEMTPELMAMLAEYYGLSEDQKLQLLQLKQSEDLRKTQMPTAIRQYKGNTEEAQGLQKMQANLLRQGQIDNAYGQANLKRAQAEQATRQQAEAQQQAQANEGVTAPVEMGYPGEGVSEENSPMHILTPPGKGKPRAPAGPLPTVPGQTMSPIRPPQSPLFGWGDALGVVRR